MGALISMCVGGGFSNRGEKGPFNVCEKLRLRCLFYICVGIFQRNPTFLSNCVNIQCIEE